MAALSAVVLLLIPTSNSELRYNPETSAALSEPRTSLTALSNSHVASRLLVFGANNAGDDELQW